MTSQFRNAVDGKPPANDAPISFSYRRIIDLTLPIESNMPPIPGVQAYIDNPSRVDVLTVITEAQKAQLTAEGLTLRPDAQVNGRSMNTMLSMLVHNGTHIDAPRHMIEGGHSIDQFALENLVKPAVLIPLPQVGANGSVSAADILATGVEFGPDLIPVIHTGWTERTWGTPAFWDQMPYLESDVGRLMVDKGVTAVAMDVFPEKTLWRGVKLAPGEAWVANHLSMLGSGIAIIQFVTNLSRIGKERFLLVAAPLNIKGGDASPARVLALVD